MTTLRHRLHLLMCRIGWHRWFNASLEKDRPYQFCSWCAMTKWQPEKRKLTTSEIRDAVRILERNDIRKK